MCRRSLKRFCALAAAVLLLIPSLSAALGAETGFSDVSSGDSCYEAVSYMTGHGYIFGCGDGTFQPARSITRSEAVTVLYRMAGSPAVSASAGFSDVPASAWYAASADWASSAGIVQGYGDGRFGPGDVLTGEQAKTLLEQTGETVFHLSSSAVSSLPESGAAEVSRGSFTVAACEYADALEQLEALRETLAPEIPMEGLTPEELLARGRQYETGEDSVQWYAAAMACYQAAAEAGLEEAASAADALNAYRAEVISSGEQGDVFTFFQTGSKAGQAGNYEQAYAIFYDDAFFFEDPVRRGIGELGNQLSTGRGVEQDLDRAVAVYTLQAEVLKNGKGYSGLAALYDAPDGTYPGIAHSTDRAIEYYLLSWNAEGLGEADFKGPRYVADYYDAGFDHDDGTHEEPDYLYAKQCYEIAAAGNGRTYDATACYKLGTYYDEGRPGIEADKAEAARYYVLAVSDKNTHATQLGVPQTYLALGRLYENGEGVEQSSETAAEYYQKAADAAEENLALSEAAGNTEEMQAVLDAAREALTRLG